MNSTQFIFLYTLWFNLSLANQKIEMKYVRLLSLFSSGNWTKLFLNEKQKGLFQICWLTLGGKQLITSFNFKVSWRTPQPADSRVSPSLIFQNRFPTLLGENSALAVSGKLFTIKNHLINYQAFAWNMFALKQIKRKPNSFRSEKDKSYRVSVKVWYGGQRFFVFMRLKLDYKYFRYNQRVTWNSGAQIGTIRTGVGLFNEISEIKEWQYWFWRITWQLFKLTPVLLCCNLIIKTEPQYLYFTLLDIFQRYVLENGPTEEKLTAVFQSARRALSVSRLFDMTNSKVKATTIYFLYHDRIDQHPPGLAYIRANTGNLGES